MYSSNNLPSGDPLTRLDKKDKPFEKIWSSVGRDELGLELTKILYTEPSATDPDSHYQFLHLISRSNDVAIK